MSQIDYEKLRLDVLDKLLAERCIQCKPNRTDMIRHLKLDDKGEYMRETTYEKYDKDYMLVGIDIRNKEHCGEIGKLIEKKEAKNLNYFSFGMVYYKSKQKLS